MGNILGDFSRWVKLRLTGPDRKEFLNGLLTNDILKLEPGQGCLACILTPQGMLRGDLELYDRGEDFLALASPKAGANLKEDLAKKIMLSQTRMEDVSGVLRLFYLTGTEAPIDLATGVEVLPRVMPHPPGFWILAPEPAAEGTWKALLEKGTNA